jgi:hypothetical protein
MGTVAFLMGDGKYGIFEIVKHLVPGLISDLSLPALLRKGRRPGPIFWTFFGGAIAVGRFAAIFTIILVVQAPAIAFAILLPGLTVHVVFGLLSGYVTWHLVEAVDEIGASQQSPESSEQ